MNMPRLLVVVVTAFFACLNLGFGQSSDVRSKLRIKQLSFDEKKTPEYSVRVSGNDKGEGSDQNEKWVVLRTDYETAPAYVDEVTFEYFLLMEAQKAENVASTTRKKENMFTHSVTYTHLKKGKHSSTMFMHPHIAERYGKVKRIAVVVKMAGATADMKSEPGKQERWWENMTPITGHMLTRDKTPFCWSEPDTYEIIKLDSRTR